LDLSGANLSGLNLSFANFSGSTFAQCQLGVGCSAANLDDANLTQANLTGISVSDATVISHDPFPVTASATATFSGANLSGTNMSNTQYGDVNFTDANLTGADLAGANFDEVNTSLVGEVTIGATLTGANFTNTILVPSNQTVTATSQAGAVATWSTPAGLPGATPGSCTPPSGSTFPLFSSTVTCQVTDANGDVATGTFQVNVAPTTQFFTRVLVPSDGTVVQGLQILDAAAADAPGIKSVVFEVSGGTLTDQVIATATPSLFGWAANWNPLSCVGGICVPNGTYSLQSVATDANGNTDTSTPITITLNIQYPVTAMVSPADGSTVSGASVSVQATASAPAGVREVGFEITSKGCVTFCFNHHFIDSQDFAAGNTSVTAGISWDSYGYPNGTYTLDSFVLDQLNQENISAPITVTIDNPPPVTLIPSDGATQSGTTALLDASATGPELPPYVTFDISGGTLNNVEIAQATPTLFGWLAHWDTTTVPNGTYTLESLGWYVSGAIGVGEYSVPSAPITITVNNPPPSTLVGLPANGASVSGSQFLDASASPGVTQVQYELSGGPNNLVDQIISGSTRTYYGWLGGWNTASVPDGTYTLNSVASYAGGVTGTSPPVTFTVAN
jgi:hypothetical protein